MLYAHFQTHNAIRTGSAAMIIDNKENHHVVGVGFTAYAINVNIGVKTATKNAATIPLLIRGYFSVTVSVYGLINISAFQTMIRFSYLHL